MKRKFLLLIAATTIIVAFIAAHLVQRAQSNLVTLNVRKMDLRQVVKKIEWQTWETILLQTNLAGPVTLNVHDMPLERVLALVAAQTGARSSTIYPLYSSSQSLEALKTTLLSESSPAPGWTNLLAAGGRPLRFGPTTNRLISLNIIARDLNFAALAFNRFAQLRVVPEDGATETVSLVLNDATPEKALDILARKSNLHWIQLYSLRRANPFLRLMRPTLDSEQAAERQVLNDQLLATLPADERAAFEQRRNQFRRPSLNPI